MKKSTKRMPIGFTKAEILLYVADKGEVDTVDLKWHLKKKLGIKNKKTILMHLSDLIKDELLSKRKKGKKGIADTYIIIYNFHTLQNVFNYLKKYKKEKDFLKTKYFKEYIMSEDFQNKFFLHLTKDLVLGMIDYMKSEDGYNRTLEIGTKTRDGFEKAFSVIKDVDIKNAKYTQIDDLDKVLKLYKNKKENIKMFYTNLLAIITKSDIDTIYTYISLWGLPVIAFIKKASKLVLLEKEKKEILAMLMASPSAIDFILNFRQTSSTGLFSILLKFILWNVNDDPDKLRKLNEISKESDYNKRIAQIYELFSDFSKLKNKSPLYTLISSNFIFDFINQNMVATEEDQLVLNNILNDLLLPKIEKSYVK